MQTGQPFPSRNNKRDNLNRNPDSSVDLYFGPAAPAGKENNWIQTVPGKGWFAVLRLYGPLEPWFDKSWRLDLEDLPSEHREAVGFIATDTRGLFDDEDADTLDEGMVPGSAIVALAIEHTWAVALVNAIVDSGAEVALNFRVPAPIVTDAFASISTDS